MVGLNGYERGGGGDDGAKLELIETGDETAAVCDGCEILRQTLYVLCVPYVYLIWLLIWWRLEDKLEAGLEAPEIDWRLRAPEG